VQRNEHWPEVGDLLIQKSDGKKHTGLITQIQERPGLGRSGVYVEWAAATPFDYNSIYGYSSLNIHNQNHVFTLIKGEKE
jgi:hypothetical protein